jgi:hypothetical protein
MGTILARVHYGILGGVNSLKLDPVPLPTDQGEAYHGAFEVGRLYRDALIRSGLNPPFQAQERLAGEFLAGLRAHRLDNSDSESEGSPV